MVIGTGRACCVRCPSCGRVEMHVFSLFNVSPTSSVRFKCGCGAVKAHISFRPRAGYVVRVRCPVCEREHAFPIKMREFAAARLLPLTCDETGLRLGFLGEPDCVEEAGAPSRLEIGELIDELAASGYFSNSRIMRESLCALHAMARDGKLTCQCGNRCIEVQVFPDKLELHCPQCGSLILIYAETDEDLQVISHVESIEMTKGGFACVDATNFKSGKRS